MAIFIKDKNTPLKKGLKVILISRTGNIATALTGTIAIVTNHDFEVNWIAGSYSKRLVYATKEYHKDIWPIYDKYEYKEITKDNVSELKVGHKIKFSINDHYQPIYAQESWEIVEIDNLNSIKLKDPRRVTCDYNILNYLANANIAILNYEEPEIETSSDYFDYRKMNAIQIEEHDKRIRDEILRKAWT